MKKKVRYISLLLAFAMLLLPVSVFAEAPAGTFFIEPGKAAQNEDGSYSFPELELSGLRIAALFEKADYIILFGAVKYRG